MKVININSILEPVVEIVLPSNRRLSDICLSMNKLFIHRRFISDKNKVLSSLIAHHLRCNDFDKSILMIRYFLLCKHNDEEIILEFSRSIFDTIVEFYKNNYNTYSNVLTIDKSKKTGYHPYYSIYKCNISKNYGWNDYNTNYTIEEAYNDYIEKKSININSIEAKNILDEYLKQFKLSYNFFSNKLRIKKLNKIKEYEND